MTNQDKEPSSNENTTPSSSEEITSPSILKPEYTLAIHKTISESRSTHGLRHGDYAQYRSYCTRRLSRLRHAKAVRRDLTHGSVGYSKEKALASGKKAASRGGRHAFHPRADVTAEDACRHENFVWVLIYDCERAWAHAMELKAEYDERRGGGSSLLSRQQGKGGSANNKKEKKKLGRSSSAEEGCGSIRRHYLRRLAKASKHATHLETVASEVCGETTVIEAKAYASWMRGTRSMEISDWESACKEYGTSLKLCKTLAHDNTPDATSATVANARQQAMAIQIADFFSARATNDIAPLLRYCQYELQRAGGEVTLEDDLITQLDNHSHVDFLNAKLASIREHRLREAASKGENMATISFRAQDIPIDNEQFRLALLKIQEFQSELSKNNQDQSSQTDGNNNNNNHEEIFLNLLSAYDDAAFLVSEELKEYENMTSGPGVNAKKKEFRCILGYIQHEKLKLLMKRNESMVNSLRTNYQANLDRSQQLKRSEAIAHLYDSLLQDARSVATLPGGPEEDEDEDEDEFVLEANANILRIRALRSHYMAQMYAADNVEKYPEAIALFEQSTLLAEQATEEISACQEMEHADEYIATMIELGKQNAKSKNEAEASAFLLQSGFLSRSSTTQAGPAAPTLLERLDDFDSGGPTYNLTKTTPSLQPIPCKPAFFDIASNFVDLYLLDEELGTLCDTYSQSSSRGILCWFRRS